MTLWRRNVILCEIKKVQLRGWGESLETDVLLAVASELLTKAVNVFAGKYSNAIQL